MGEVAEMMLDGTLCAGCGQYLGDEPVGYPVHCSDCNPNQDNPEAESYESSNPNAKWEKRASNREWSTNHLVEKGVMFEAKNDGAHLIVTHGLHVVDFWPGTGKYIFRNGGPKGRGIRNLLSDLEVG